LFTSHQECPQCGATLSAEHFAKEVLPKHEVTLLHCEFCSHGWETLWKEQGGVLHEQYTLEFDAKRDAVDYGKFLQRLKDRRAA